MKALEYFLCPICDKEHSAEDEAQECCPAFACPTCNEIHYTQKDAFKCCEIKGLKYMCSKCLEWHSNKDDADKCCTDLALRDDLETAGQLRLRMPL